jgi:hypothetical protein
MLRKTITVEELINQLEAHQVWLKDNTQGKRLELSEVDLSTPRKSKLLKKYNLSRARLRYVNLSWVDLSGINLSYANLVGSCLKYANLSHANLLCTYLVNADLRNAHLSHADLRHADLTHANLVSIDLRNASLKGACFRGVNLNNTAIDYIDFTQVEDFYIPYVCPCEGSFIGWKRISSGLKYHLLKLEIPIDAKRHSGTTRVCQCDKVKVLEILDFYGTPTDIQEVKDCFTGLVYKVGEVTHCKSWNDNRFVYNSGSIEFFIDKREYRGY